MRSSDRESVNMPDKLLSMLVVSSFGPFSHRLDIVREYMEWRERERGTTAAVVVVFLCRFCRIRGTGCLREGGGRRDRVCIHVMVSKRPQHCRVLAGTEPIGSFFNPLIPRRMFDDVLCLEDVSCSSQNPRPDCRLEPLLRNRKHVLAGQ